MKKSNNISFILEIFWLIIAVFLAILGIVNFIKSGFYTSYMFFIMAISATLLYYARRYMRRKSTDTD